MLDPRMKEIHRLQVELMNNHYARALEAKRDGRPVVYVSAMFPVEIVKAFEPDLAAVYPENHAALLIARGQTQALRRAESEGLDRMGCAYELFNTGYLLNGHAAVEADDPTDPRGSPIPKLPQPDALLACDNQCRVICEWFKHVSEMYGDLPYMMINVGDRFTGVLEQNRIDYIKTQLREVIAWLENLTGTTMTEDRLLRTAEQSAQALDLWKQYLDLGTLVPSPITAFDGFSHMALIVSERGRPEAIDYYAGLLEATRSLAETGYSPVGQERRRLLWDNLATWYNFREIQNQLAEHGLAVVGSNYLDAWRKEVDCSSSEALLDSLARSYASIYTNMTISERIALYVEAIDKFKIDGVLFHNNLSCHTFSLRVGEIAAALEKRFAPDFRTIVFEGCQGVAGRFQKHAFETGLGVHFVER